MKKVKTFLFLMAAAVLVTSCGATKTSAPFKTPTRLEIQMNDLVYLGESEISCEYSVYLGLFHHIETLNGEPYVPGSDEKLDIPGLAFANEGLRLAAAKVLEDYPAAEYFQVVLQTERRDVLFLGATVERRARIRAYRFRDSTPAERLLQN